MTKEEQKQAIIDRVLTCCECTLFVHNKCVPKCHDKMFIKVNSYPDVKGSEVIRKMNTKYFAAARRKANSNKS